MYACLGSLPSKRSLSVARGSVQHKLEREALLRRYLLCLDLWECLEWSNISLMGYQSSVSVSLSSAAAALHVRCPQVCCGSRSLFPANRNMIVSQMGGASAIEGDRTSIGMEERAPKASSPLEATTSQTLLMRVST